MQKLYVTPYIESILADITDADRSLLKTALNSSSEDAAVVVFGKSEYGLDISRWSNAHVKRIAVDLGDGNPRSGIVVYKSASKFYFLKPQGTDVGPIELYTLTVNNGVLTGVANSGETVGIAELRNYLTDTTQTIGAVTAVNGKTGAVTLVAGDINATNSTSIQANLERIDAALNGIEAKLPDVSDVPGVYSLQCTVTEEGSTFAWVKIDD